MSPFGDALEARDLDRAIGLLAEDVVFRSPVVFREYHGRDAVAPRGRAGAAVFEDFAYVHELGGGDPGTEALTFRARIGDRRIEGCDLVTWDAGEVRELVVMVRPLSGVLALVEGMQKALAIASGQSPSR